MVARYGIGYVVFNDHVPHAALAAGKRPARLIGQALKAGRSPEAHLALLNRLHDNAGAVPAALTALAARLRAQDVRLGSHDDATAEIASWPMIAVPGSRNFPKRRTPPAPPAHRVTRW